MDGAPFCPSVIGNKDYQRHKMNNPELSIARLEASLDAKIERYFDTLDTDPDVLKQLLADKRSENTRRAYERDVNDF
jgi:integrase/recombinase XerC